MAVACNSPDDFRIIRDQSTWAANVADRPHQGRHLVLSLWDVSQPPTRPRASTLRISDLEDFILETFDSPGYRPPELPKVAMEMLELSHKLEVPVERIAGVLQRDAVLAARVLQRARSVHYAGTAKIDTLQGALVQLGIGALRNLVLETAIQSKVFRSKEFEKPMERLRCHTIAVAHLSRLVAARAKLNAETAYLCGLMHDVGIAGALLVLAPAYGSIDPALLWPALGAVHDRVGTALVQLWGLPEEVAGIVAAHHKVDEAKPPQPLLAVLRTAEGAAIGVGASLFPPSSAEELNFELPTKEGVLQARSAIALQDRDLQEIGREAAQTLPALDPELARLMKEEVAKHAPPPKTTPDT
jgi:HD-like signal output (HDOD) protein